MQYHALPCITMQYHAIQCNAMQYSVIQYNSMKYHSIPRNTMQYHAIPCSTMQYHAIPCNTMQYHEIPCNTMQYHAIPCLINNYWRSVPLPCGQYIAIFFICCFKDYIKAPFNRNTSIFLFELDFVCFHLAFSMQARPWAEFIVFSQKFQLAVCTTFPSMANET